MMRTLLAPLGIAFNQAVRLRSRLYEAHFFSQVKLSRAVVSIGNLTVGGTGKTPVVDAVLTQFEARKLNCAVLTRGYGRASGESLIVNSGSKASEVGDEPLWLFQRHLGAQIAVGADRVGSAALLEPDIFILDDGFQHRRVKRDFEIVLVDCSRPIWHYRPLPWGYARESFEALDRADLVILTRVNQADPETWAAVTGAVKKLEGVLIIESALHFDLCVELISGEMRSVGAKRVALYSAIGNPESFYKTVTSAGAIVCAEIKAADHAPVDASLVKSIIAKTLAVGADYLLITEKDAVKWRECVKAQPAELKIPVLVVRTVMKFKPELPDIYDLAINHSR